MVTITVNPEPVVVNQTGTICSDIANGIILGNDVDTPTVVTYNITAINNGGLVASAGNPVTGTGFLNTEIANDAWTNIGVSSVNVIYTLVPVSAIGCEGNPFKVTVKIESELAVASQIATVCSDVVNGIILGTEPTATYTITSIVSNGLLASAGNPQVGTGFLANDIADDAWTNLGTTPVVIVYNIIPQSSSGCLGNPFNITLTVNPEPIVTNQNLAVCSDEISNVILGNDIDGPSATSYIINTINSNGLIPFSGNPLIGAGFLANEIADDAWTNTTLLTVPVVYKITPVTADGCQGNPFTISIKVNPQINIAVSTTPITCYGGNDGSITLTVTGGTGTYQGSWDNLATGLFQNNLSAGTYTILITDANNCTKPITVNLPEPPIFTVNPVVKQISCFGANDGSINLNFVGGIAPIILTWSDGSTAGTTRNNLGPGTYSVIIKDSKPCIISKLFTISEPQPLVLSTNVTDALDCDNANTGSINLLVSGGTPPFTYVWSNGAITEDLINISAGNYLVTVTDARGCTKSIQNSINRPPPIAIEIITKTDFDCNTKYVKQTFEANVSGGLPPYLLNWSSGTVSGINNEFMNTNLNGTIILGVTDALGCKANYSYNVNTPTLGTPDLITSSFGYTTYGFYSVNDPIQFTNKATGDYVSMIWDFGDGTFSNQLNPIHQFAISKNYVVKQIVTYPFGCVYTNTITLMVEKGYLLVIPTAFTPNNDSVNDTYRPVTKALKNVHLDIYDTWGSLIYSEIGGDVLKGWDGKIKGVISENGNYFCKVSAETFYGTIINESTPLVLIK
jgi:gliding motility-associated-like protein